MLLLPFPPISVKYFFNFQIDPSFIISFNKDYSIYIYICIYILLNIYFSWYCTNLFPSKIKGWLIDSTGLNFNPIMNEIIATSIFSPHSLYCSLFLSYQFQSLVIVEEQMEKSQAATFLIILLSRIYFGNCFLL